MKRIAMCCCKDLSIEVVGLPLRHGVCHCNNCKRRSGSAFGISAYFEDQQIVRKTGTPCVYEKNSKLFGQQKRYFCRRCGTTLYWKLDAMLGQTGIAGGCFTDNPLPEPTRTSNKGDFVYDWVLLPEHWDRPDEVNCE